MKAIFEFCEDWEHCEKSRDLRDLFEKKIIERDKFKLPPEEELEILNEVCKQCKTPLLIEERKCPVCENEDLQPPKLIIGGEGGSIEVYNYRCEPCDRVLYSHGKFI